MSGRTRRAPRSGNLIAASIPPTLTMDLPHHQTQGLNGAGQELSVDRLGITHTPVESQHFHFQSCVRYEQPTLRQEIDPQGGDAARFPERNCRQDVLKILLCCTLLRSIFRNATQDSSEWARCFSCDGGIRSHALQLVPFIDVELRIPAWHQICLRIPCGLFDRILKSPTSRTTGTV